MMRNRVVLYSLAMIFCAAGLASGEVFKPGGDRLVATQNADGGWTFMLAKPAGSASNIVAPTGMGLLKAYEATGDPNYVTPLKKAGDYLTKKTQETITPDDGYFAAALDKALGVTTYTDFLKRNFYNPLAADQYDILTGGVWYVDTRQYVSILRWVREQQKMPNLAALDCGIGLYSAGLVKADTSQWVAGTKAEINELDAGDVYDVIGLAGAVLGLASVDADFDPTSGAFAAAKSLVELGDALAACQLSTGGFTWNSKNMAEGAGNESVQETAMAILALNEVDCARFAGVIAKACTYLKSTVLATGGWENFVGEGENNEVTGESLWAIRVAGQIQVQKP
jgi:hypothetical protein